MFKTEASTSSFSHGRDDQPFFLPVNKTSNSSHEPERPQPPCPSGFLHSQNTRFPPSWRVQSPWRTPLALICPRTRRPALLAAPTALRPGPSSSGPVPASQTILPAHALTLRPRPRPPGRPRPRLLGPARTDPTHGPRRPRPPRADPLLHSPTQLPAVQAPHTVFRTPSQDSHRPRPQGPTHCIA